MSFARPLSEVFAFFIQPANLIVLTPPQLHMRLVDGPERIVQGARLTFKGRRWGISHRAVSEITRLETDKLFVDSQIEGPFRKWVHTHAFESAPPGTRVRDTIDFEPPGGILGLVITARFVEKDLSWVFAYRAKKLRELLGD
jgi:ligand-binding SRPBCC domain-containing protein